LTKISLYLDEHVQLALAESLRARGVDVLTTQEAGNICFSDVDQLIFAKEKNEPYFHTTRDILQRFIMSG
jgi:hypothetical protein